MYLQNHIFIQLIGVIAPKLQTFDVFRGESILFIIDPSKSSGLLFCILRIFGADDCDVCCDCCGLSAELLPTLLIESFSCLVDECGLSID